MIRFLLDDELVELDDSPADLTVLDWLRLYRHRTGTKEGCGSGDCGACTVVTVSSTDDGLQYRSINSCITFVGDLHGKQLLTVESLGSPEKLHPVQRAMAVEHGSQCGFCTPGFVMSIFALVKAPDAPVVTREGSRAGMATTDTAISGTTPASSTEFEKSEVRAPQASPVWLENLHCENPGALSHKIDRALGGNLCRCTGYRPIKRAAAVALADTAVARTMGSDDASPAPWIRNQPSSRSSEWLVERLDSIASEPSSHARFHRPGSLASLARLVEAHPDASLLAGGTDLALEVTQQMATLERIIAVGQVPELQMVDVQPQSLTLGAAVSLNRCLDVMRERIPHSESLLLRFGSDQVRNQGTIGGNIGSASPIGDLPPMLLALDASVILQKGDRRRRLALTDYFLDYRKTALEVGEFIRAVHIPLPETDALFAIHKVSKRIDDDISAVCGAFHLRFDGTTIRQARVAFGGMAAIPKRANRIEAVLTGRRFDHETIRAAMQAMTQDFTPMSDARASADYRLKVARNLLMRVLLESQPVAPATRIHDPAVSA